MITTAITIKHKRPKKMDKKEEIGNEVGCFLANKLQAL